MKLAEQEGIRTPKTEVVSKLDDLKDWNIRNGFPAVLKANGTSGGYGVRIVNTMEEAERALRFLQAPPRLLRAAKHALLDRDVTLILPALRRRQFVVNAQAFVDGREATSAVACWKGKVLAALHFEVVSKRSSSGPATVVRRIENAEMSAAAEKMVRRLNLSGVHGFDFMLEEQTGNAYLIEINPRATQVCHLAFGSERDIPAALCAALSGKDAQPAPIVTEKDTIALFPQEWTRDSESQFLQSGYHDVPWEEPELVRDCVNSRRKQSNWYSRTGQEPTSSAIRSSKPVTTPAENRAVGLD
jgi:predicted ATP-grasp superfamily ATP-dependent carboligase